MRTCVVIPTYNEKENVGPVVEALMKAGVPDLQVLFVDDRSPDGTPEEIRRISSYEPRVHLLLRDSKRGIGSAYQEGFAHAMATLDPEVLVEMDADLQHPPGFLRELLTKVEEGADVAIASRYVRGGGMEGWGRGRRMISAVANSYARFFLRLSVKDCTSGFRTYRKSAAKLVVEASLPAKGFEFQVATLAALKGRATMVEVPYTFSHRRAGRSKLGFADVIRFFFSVLRMSFA